MAEKIRRELREFVFMTIGTGLVAAGVYFFKFPNHFSTGGVSGLSVVLGAVVTIPFLTPGAFVTLINVVFLVLGFLLLNRGFGLRTVYCTLLFSGLVQGMEYIYPMEKPFTDQPLLELFFAVILPALGSAILFNLGASTGGTDIAAMILKKYSSMDIGRALLCSDILISGAAFFVFGVETGLFSILGLILKSVVVDTVIESLNRKKSFTIITSEPETACEFITQRLKRGATVWEAEGAYTHDRRWVVLTALSQNQAAALRRYLKLSDPKAFLLVTNSSEIFGKGFMRT